MSDPPAAIGPKHNTNPCCLTCLRCYMHFLLLDIWRPDHIYMSQTCQIYSKCSKKMVKFLFSRQLKEQRNVTSIKLIYRIQGQKNLVTVTFKSENGWQLRPVDTESKKGFKKCKTMWYCCWKRTSEFVAKTNYCVSIFSSANVVCGISKSFRPVTSDFKA